MKIKDTIKDFCYRQLFPRAGLLLVKIISRTYRYRLVDTENEQRALENNGAVVYASWHQRFFPGITFFATRKPIAIIISQSRDGEMISRVVDILGWRSVRGSSSKGGTRALKELRSLTRQGYRVGHIVDGPQGPFGVIKPGLLTIAQFSGAPILPVITSAERRWVFNSWDRFMVPKPFSRVFVRFGKPIFVPRRLNPDDFESLRRDVEKQIKELTTQTDNWWRSPEMIGHYFP
ncbi:lysophospholipid acyltransferase family protein [uncultured Desulfosarcina sp.]|uniref:lysophospholipid acyltransferase family protein n=1 Tax=uncultured Desulfosarcina sp. TaxID=218289 RepID=UPI0029C64620|nr:lysophospholipid acyltransferase family protein [uncultured Desulfosarcina sp.]